MSTVTPTRSDEHHPDEANRRKRGWLVAAAAGVVGVLVVAGGLGLSGTGPLGGFAAPTASDAETRAVEAVGVAEAYLTARDAYDAEAARPLLTDDVTIRKASFRELEELEPAFEALRLYGFTVSPFDCEAASAPGEGAADDPIDVTCGYMLDSRLQHIVEHPPIPATFRFTVEDGLVTSMSDGFPYGTYSPNVWEPFSDWVDRRDSWSYGVLYESAGNAVYTRLTPEALELIPQVLDEYEAAVASQQE